MEESWKTNLIKDPVPWLLSSDPWTRYRTLTDLASKSDRTSVTQAYREMVRNEAVRRLAYETKDWISVAPTRNNDAKISYFKLRMLADFGVNWTDMDLENTINKAMEHVLENMFAVRGALPEKVEKGKKYEKPDLAADVWHVSPCNSPAITAALLGLSVKNEKVDAAVSGLTDKWLNDTGWFCHLFFVENQFKKLQTGCPMAGLMALDVFSRVPGLKESDHARHAYEPIKYHREYGKTIYYFGRSKKFWTLKYPFVWYNALYLAEVLTRFEFLKDEPLVGELVDWILREQDESGRFRPTSMFMEYKNWDFSNKKEASPWITFLCCRILKQYFG